jgi:hypothetical protein
MNRLGFLAGEWSGEATVLRGPGQVVDMNQSESAGFKLGGLVLMIEGVGRSKADGKAVLQALGLITFDNASATYHMRAFNDGRWLESEIKIIEEGRAISWGFSLGEMSTKSVLRIDDNGAWTEAAELTIGTRPPIPLLNLTVHRVPR